LATGDNEICNKYFINANCQDLMWGSGKQNHELVSSPQKKMIWCKNLKTLDLIYFKHFFLIMSVPHWIVSTVSGPHSLYNSHPPVLLWKKSDIFLYFKSMSPKVSGRANSKRDCSRIRMIFQYFFVVVSFLIMSDHFPIHSSQYFVSVVIRLEFPSMRHWPFIHAIIIIIII
jgi:hypothetical protein